MTLYYTLDCTLRRERDETRRMQLALRMGSGRDRRRPTRPVRTRSFAEIAEKWADKMRQWPKRKLPDLPA